MDYKEIQERRVELKQQDEQGYTVPDGGGSSSLFSVGGCKNLTDESIKAIAQNCTGLTHLASSTP